MTDEDTLETVPLPVPEAFVTQAISRLAGLQAVTEALSQSLTPEEVTRVVLARGLPLLQASAGSVALLTADGRELEMIGSVGYPEAWVEPFRRFSVEAPAPMAEAVRNAEAIFLESWQEWLARYPRVREDRARRPEDRAWAALPLVAKGGVIGAVAFTFSTIGAFSGDDRAFMLALTRQCAQALERARLYEATERSEQRLVFLARASAALAESLDYETTLARMARLVVPDLADWCGVDIRGADGRLGRLAVAHIDPAKVEWGWELQRRYPPDPDAPGGVYEVLRTGQSAFYPDVTDAMLVAGARDSEELAIHRALGFRSVMIVPLTTRGRTLGVLTFVTTAESGKRYTQDDLRLAQDLALRAALAVDNARLYRDAHEERQRQRLLLREILYSVSEKKLRLCDGTDELPAKPPSRREFAPLTGSALAALRHETRRAAEDAGMSEARWQDLVTAVSEAGMNAVVHAEGGTAEVCATPGGTVQVWVQDRGAGIAVQNLHRATLERGFTTAGTLGHGFWMILKLVDRVWLLTGLSGTTLVLEQDPAPP